MASVITVLRTCGLIVFIIIGQVCGKQKDPEPWIVSISVSSKECVENSCKYSLKVHGGEFLGHYSWRLTPEAGPRGGSCETFTPNYELREINTDQWDTEVEVKVPHDEWRYFFCLRHSDQRKSPFSGKWVHQGQDLFLDPKNDAVSLVRGATQPQNRSLQITRDSLDTVPQFDLSKDTDVNNLPSVNRPARHESRDIEIYVKNKYVPLDVLSENVQRFNDDNAINDQKYNYNNVINDINSNVNNNDENNGQFQIDGKDAYESWNDKANFSVRKRRDLKNVEDIPKTGDTSNAKKAISKETRETETRNKFENATDELITTLDILEAKTQLENTIKPVENEENHEDSLLKPRFQRQVAIADVAVKQVETRIKVEGIRVEDAEKEPKIIENGIPSVLADSRVTLRVFGEGITERMVIAFTYDANNYDEPCKFPIKGEYVVKSESITPKSGLFDIIPPPPKLGSKLYICAKNLKVGSKDPSEDGEKYFHQGQEPFKILATHEKLLPLWVSLILILVCLMFSALFSGLNLGLMSLDRTELKIISNTGTEQERKYARAIMPVRDHGNYLLCSILLGNVAVNSTFTILLDELTSGLFAVIFSTLAIVLLGEITPQAICSRHGLMVGAKSIMITKAVMAITAPLAFPVSKLLDFFLGEEIGNVYNRERLKELVKVTTDVNDLDKDEVNIISGALELRKKTVSDVMTKLEDVFMLPITSVLDFETMSEIVKSGYSRIPVYEGHRGNIVTVLFIKDLAFVDPDDNTPLRTLCQYYQNPCNFVFEDVTLDVMFKQFKDGHKGHMAFVHRINNEGEGDPFYETIGLVTLEDVIEEMIQAEIIDETDVFMDNRTKRRRNRPANKLQDFTAFAERHENQRIHISPQLTLATFQFLSTSVDAFRPDMVSETVLRRLLRQDVIHHIKLKGKTKKDPSTYVFHQGKPVDYFVLILEGRVEVTVGRENLVFEAGPFTYFGVQALMQNVGVVESPTPSAMGSLQNINMDSMLRHTFVPDYSVRAISDTFYLTVKRSLYLAAKRATLMEKGALSKGATNEQFDTEVDKHLCNSSSANVPITLLSKKLLGKSTSTASTRDDLGSTSTGYKLSPAPRVNIIELLQTRGQAAGGSWSRADTDASKSLASSWETANWAGLQDPEYSKSLAGACAKPERTEDADPFRCIECVRNNFWMKGKDLVDPNEIDSVFKKKKTTFHTDSSLLTFHPVSPPTHDIESFNFHVIHDLKNTKSDTKNNRPKDESLTPQNSCFDSTFHYDSNLIKTRSITNFGKVTHANEQTNKIHSTARVERQNSNNNTNAQNSSNNSGQNSRSAELKISLSKENSSRKEDNNIRNEENEFEKRIVDYSQPWREERLALERRRIETEERVLTQLAMILHLLQHRENT